ncbi:hypothetical protein GXW71_20290 [Roseomonas hellenica]|uniref:Uncharacterized protein n=1 Tax=Plastoroseomonas hellenica TaxID=2687306 RepID=A0ABS5F2B5_9PROT|nr:hypothetical protein [Plastoroseomonas hellenica]MBR0666710.1 hypothetical protein [Plastoroseomonas hellenica]
MQTEAAHAARARPSVVANAALTARKPSRTDVRRRRLRGLDRFAIEAACIK